MDILDRTQPDIRTERLVLRAWRTNDAETLFELFNHWDVVRWLSLPPWPYALEDARDYVGRVIDQRSDESSLVITLRDALVGSIGVRLHSASHLQREAGPNIGFWLGQAYWGQGYMTEALSALAQNVLENGPHTKIYSGAFAENVASLRVQKKIGFVRDGETMLHSRPRGGEFPHINTVLTRTRFAPR